MIERISREEDEVNEGRKGKSLKPETNKLNEEQIGKMILDASFKVHTTLGPGLLESVYEEALAIELKKSGLQVERQKLIPVVYDGHVLETGFRADLIVNNLVLIELKSVEAITPLFKKITTNYLKLIPLRLGFLINFNEIHLKDGIMRITNGLEGKDFFADAASSKTIDFNQPSRPSSPSRSSRELPL